MELYDFSWQAFRQTGGIEAYLLLKNIENRKENEEKERQCQTLNQEG